MHWALASHNPTVISDDFRESVGNPSVCTIENIDQIITAKIEQDACGVTS
jgi:hypothetical protein